MLAREIRLLNDAKTPPFQIADDAPVSEDTRLRYRYLDLRRARMQQNLALRHEVCLAFRQYLDSQGFLEIETPILTRSTPEGARDYLVPSRVHPGEFYALPQSPQIFKQILMVAGMDRYFQICRCFRDEDLRADRQPEFTQVDVEISFATRDLVFGIVEGTMQEVMRTIGREIHAPFRRMPYDEAMARYGSDKPDLRPGMPIHDLSDVFRESTFNVFREAVAAGGAVRALVVEGAAGASRRELDELVEQAKQAGASGLVWARRADGVVQSSALKAAGEATMARALDEAEVAENGLLLLAAAADAVSASTWLGQLRLSIAKQRGLLKPDVFELLWVVDFPLFEWSEDEKRHTPMHHPFTSPADEDIEPARERSGRRPREGVRPRDERVGDRRRQHPNPQPRAAAHGLPSAGNLGRGGAGPLRILPRRARVRHAAARRYRVRPRSDRRAPRGGGVDPRRHGLSQDGTGGRSHGGRAVAGRHAAVTGASHQGRALDS